MDYGVYLSNLQSDRSIRILWGLLTKKLESPVKSIFILFYELHARRDGKIIKGGQNRFLHEWFYRIFSHSQLINCLPETELCGDFPDSTE